VGSVGRYLPVLASGERTLEGRTTGATQEDQEAPLNSAHLDDFRAEDRRNCERVDSGF
jgi:hypothetical protein